MAKPAVASSWPGRAESFVGVGRWRGKWFTRRDGRTRFPTCHRTGRLDSSHLRSNEGIVLNHRLFDDNSVSGPSLVTTMTDAYGVNDQRSTRRCLNFQCSDGSDKSALARTYVILVLPKCLLTWGYVKVDAAAFCLQHDDRHGESAGPVEI